MKRQKSIAAWLRLLVVTGVVATLMGTVAVQAATLPNSITVQGQDLNSGVIVVSEVTAAENGWIVIYKDPGFAVDMIVGYAPVVQGANAAVKVTINTNRVDSDVHTLWARLHVDKTVNGLFEWGLRDRPYNDAPVSQNGQYVTAAFATTSANATPIVAAVQKPSAPAAKPAKPAPSAAKPAAPAANQINITRQDLNTGVMLVDSVTAAEDGWIVIYKDPGFASGAIVGYAPVHTGVNSGVKVTIKANRLDSGEVTLWARLHVDKTVNGLFEWGLRDRPYNDAPVVQNGQYVTTAVGVTVPE